MKKPLALLALALLLLLAFAARTFGQSGGTGGGNPPVEIRRGANRAQIDVSGNVYFDLATGKRIRLKNTCAGAAVAGAGEAVYCYDNTAKQIKVSIDGNAFATWATVSGADGATLNATNNTLPKRQSATAFTDSLLSDNGTSITASGSGITFTSANALITFGSNRIGYTDGTGFRITDGSSQNTLTFNVQSLSTNRAVIWPDKAGTVALTNDLPATVGYLELPEQGTAPATPTNAARFFVDSSNRFSWKGENGFVRTFDGTANTADRLYILPNANSSFPVYVHTVTYTGLTAARTVTYPDANFTAARTDAGNTFTGNQTFAANIDVASSGFIGNANGALVASTARFGFNGRGDIRAATDGVFTLFNNANNDFTRLQFGGTSSSFNSVGRFGNATLLRNAAGTVPTFATLTACSATGAGAMSPVSDSTTDVWGATITGGGALHVLAYCNGTNWTVAAK